MPLTRNGVEFKNNKHQLLRLPATERWKRAREREKEKRSKMIYETDRRTDCGVVVQHPTTLSTVRLIAVNIKFIVKQDLFIGQIQFSESTTNHVLLRTKPNTRRHALISTAVVLISVETKWKTNDFTRSRVTPKWLLSFFVHNHFSFRRSALSQFRPFV